MNSRQLEFMLAVGIYNTKLIVRICGVAEQGLEACTLRLKVWCFNIWAIQVLPE